MYLGGRYGMGGQLSSVGDLNHFILFARLNNIHGLFSDFFKKWYSNQQSNKHSN